MGRRRKPSASPPSTKRELLSKLSAAAATSSPAVPLPSGGSISIDLQIPLVQPPLAISHPPLVSSGLSGNTRSGQIPPSLAINKMISAAAPVTVCVPPTGPSNPTSVFSPVQESSCSDKTLTSTTVETPILPDSLEPHSPSSEIRRIERYTNHLASPIPPDGNSSLNAISVAVSLNPWERRALNNAFTEEKKLTKVGDYLQPVTLTDEDTDSTYTRCLIGYFVDTSPGLSEVYKMQASWGVPLKVFQHKSNWFVFKFDNITDLDKVINRGPYFINTRPMLLKKMPPNFTFNTDDISNTNVWIRLPNLPIDYYTTKALGKICAFVGNPLHIDQNTLDKEKFNFARVLLEVNLKKLIPNSIPITLPNGDHLEQIVEFENLPVYCRHCCIPGHPYSECASRPPPSGSNTVLINQQNLASSHPFKTVPGSHCTSNRQSINETSAHIPISNRCVIPSDILPSPNTPGPAVPKTNISNTINPPTIINSHQPDGTNLQQLKQIIEYLNHIQQSSNFAQCESNVENVSNTPNEAVGDFTHIMDVILTETDGVTADANNLAKQKSIGAALSLPPKEACTSRGIL